MMKVLGSPCTEAPGRRTEGGSQCCAPMATDLAGEIIDWCIQGPARRLTAYLISRLKTVLFIEHLFNIQYIHVGLWKKKKKSDIFFNTTVFHFYSYCDCVESNIKRAITVITLPHAMALCLKHVQLNYTSVTEPTVVQQTGQSSLSCWWVSN